MAVLGLLLLLAGVGAAVDVGLQNTSAMSAQAFGQRWTLSLGSVFLLGAATGLVAFVGLILLVAGMARIRRRRLATRASLDAAEAVRAERDRLAVELSAERAQRSSPEDSIDLRGGVGTVGTREPAPSGQAAP